LAAGSGLCEGSDIPGGVGDIRTEELIGNCLPMDMAQAEGGGGGHGPFEMTGLIYFWTEVLISGAAVADHFATAASRSASSGSVT
jgi:hypothetical protein